MWSDASKHKMREAMHMAGLSSSVNTENLTMGLEPEAALIDAAHMSNSIHDGDVALALDCGADCFAFDNVFSVPSSRFILFSLSLTLSLSHPHKRICSCTLSPLVSSLDTSARLILRALTFFRAGGGTTDLAACKVSHGTDGRLAFRHVARSRGVSDASMTLDPAFFKLLDETFGADTMERVFQQDPRRKVQLQSKWESVKRSFKGQDDNESEIELPSALSRLMDESALKRLAEINQEFEAYLECDEVLVVSPQRMRDIYEPTIRRIVACAEEMIADCTSAGSAVSKVVLAGGFCESTYLVARLRDHFTRHSIPVMVNENPGASVLRGTVLYSAHWRRLRGWLEDQRARGGLLSVTSTLLPHLSRYAP
jgi:hypothetical protein